MSKPPRNRIVNAKLRLHPGLHATIKRAAKAAGRSFNGEVLHRLEQSLAQDRDVDLAAGLARVEAVAARLLATENAGLCLLIHLGLHLPISGNNPPPVSGNGA